MAIPHSHRDDTVSSRNDASVCTASPDAGTPSSTSSIGGFEVVGEANESDAGADTTDAATFAEEGIILAPDDTTPVHKFLPRLHALARVPVKAANWDLFVSTMEEASTAKIPARFEGIASRLSTLDPGDAQSLQTLPQKPEACHSVHYFGRGRGVQYQRQRC